MFGYLDIDKKNIEDGQRGLWQSFMCALCFSTKKLFGNIPRMFITNDINTFNVLFHSILQTDVELTKSRCFAHPVRKQTMVANDELTDKLSIANVLLTRWNLYDDVVDDKSFKKKVALSAFSRAYKKAKKMWPQLDQTICNRYTELRDLEQSGCSSIDQVAHSFAVLSQDFCSLTLGENDSEFAQNLCYNLGKWIYLIDALDDIEKDLKHKQYNPFVSCYSLSAVNEITEHIADIQFTMYAVLNRIAQCFNDLSLTKYHCVLTNILFQNIRQRTAEILNNIKQKIVTE